jgi:MFS family permease
MPYMNIKTSLKSIGAVLAGFLTVFILSVVTDMIVEAAGILPSATNPQDYEWWHYAIALAYRTVWTILGGYVTARLAPFNPRRHVIILGILGTIGGIAGIFAGWQYGHHWYPILLAVLAFPSVWLGGKPYIKR